LCRFSSCPQETAHEFLGGVDGASAPIPSAEVTAHRGANSASKVSSCGMSDGPGSQLGRDEGLPISLKSL
ncbi:unnamed protein product, partial [Musa textilis]